MQTPTGKPFAGAVGRSTKARGGASVASRVPAIIVGVIVAVIAGLSIWYLVRPQPLLVQGEMDATRLDIAARVDGRVADIPVERGEDVAAGAVLVRIDNPETLAKREQALAAKVVADARLANIKAGTRAEGIAARKAALARSDEVRCRERRKLGSRPRARGLARRDARSFDHSSMSQTASLA